MRSAALIVVGGALALAAGCHLPHLFVALTKPREYKTIKAEHKLSAERLVIVPYVGTDVLFTYPDVPLEVSREIIYAILGDKDLKGRIKMIEHPVRVVQWQESNLDWAGAALEDVGKLFEADTVLYVEIQRYTLVEELSANLYRGRVKARCQVVKAGGKANPVYDAVLEVVFPPDQPVSILGTSDAQMRYFTNRELAQTIVHKFVDRRVEVIGGKP